MTCVKNNAIICVIKNAEREKHMNDKMYIYFGYVADNREKRREIKEAKRYLDELVDKYGWKYSGWVNCYIPKVRDTREETVDRVKDAIKSDERLKKYFPKVMISTLTNICGLEEIEVSNMTDPEDAKYSRYERDYLETKELTHGIIVDETKKIRDGYISYLLAKKYGCKVDIMEAPSESPIYKMVVGHYVEYDEEQHKYISKDYKIHSWIYNLEEAVVVGDILIVQTSEGQAYIEVYHVTNTAGKGVTNRYKKAVANVTALNEITRS